MACMWFIYGLLAFRVFLLLGIFFFLFVFFGVFFACCFANGHFWNGQKALKVAFVRFFVCFGIYPLPPLFLKKSPTGRITPSFPQILKKTWQLLNYVVICGHRRWGRRTSLEKSACFGARAKKGRGWHRGFCFLSRCQDTPLVARVLAVFLSCVEVVSFGWCESSGFREVGNE